MFKNKDIIVTIRTREKNEDDQKIEILVDSYKLPGTELIRVSTEKGLLISFEAKEKWLRRFMDDLTFLNVVGVYGERI